MVNWVYAKYGEGCRATLALGLHIEVGHDGIATRNGPPVKYVARVFATTLLKRFDTREEAKAAAERAAKAFMTTALQAFE